MDNMPLLLSYVARVMDYKRCYLLRRGLTHRHRNIYNQVHETRSSIFTTCVLGILCLSHVALCPPRAH